MNSALLRTLLVYGIVLPVAVILGWMLSTPMNLQSLTVIGAAIFIVLLPLILAHHHAILIFSCQALLNAFFLPGQPVFWTLMVAINIVMMVGYRILQRRPLFISAPPLTISIGLLIAVVLLTAKYRGGIGMRVLGSGSFGGRQYFNLLMALLGYFALASQAIPWDKVKRYTGYFYLSGSSAAVSHFLYYFPPLYFLYAVFPVGFAVGQYVAEQTGILNRLGGLTIAASSAVYFILARYGLRGTFSLRAPWRLIFFVILFIASLFGGYRSVFVFIVGLCAILYLLEGLLFTRWTAIVLVAGGLSLAAIIPFAHSMPRQIQRVLCVLPVDVDADVRLDAVASIEWRTRMWSAVVPELGQYFWLGKGYSIDPTDMFLMTQAIRRGFAPDYSVSLMVGDYHNGPLSVYVPFGSLGCIAFLAFIIAGWRALYLNWRNGPAAFRVLNTFFLGYFITKTLFFFSIFGSLHSDLFQFTSVLGISVAVNRGICRRPVVERTRQAPATFGLASGSAAA